MEKKSLDPRKKRGAAAEELVARYCVVRGYRIVERNWRRAEGEIDIIAEKEGVLYFIEVRSRSQKEFGEPVESITAAKKKQMLKMAAIYLQELGGERECSLALAAVRLDKNEVRLILDMF